jgi:hypothetical protein
LQIIGFADTEKIVTAAMLMQLQAGIVMGDVKPLPAETIVMEAIKDGLAACAIDMDDYIRPDSFPP